MQFCWYIIQEVGKVHVKAILHWDGGMRFVYCSDMEEAHNWITAQVLEIKRNFKVVASGVIH